MSLPTRLGLVGGTFDPVHVGHLAAARAAQDALGLTAMRFVPSHHPPHRPHGPAAPGPARLAMLEAALADAGEPSWAASTIELERPGPSYTSETLAHLAADGFEPTSLYFVLGIDAFVEIASWHEYPAVLDMAHFVVIARDGSTLGEATRLPAAVTSRIVPPEALARGTVTGVAEVRAETPDISSTAIRTRIGSGLPIVNMVPPSVEAYIDAHGLYRTDQAMMSAPPSGR